MVAANFEISVLSNKIIPIKTLTNILNKRGLTFRFESLELIDNWDYENQVSLDINTDMEVATEYSIKGKIVMLSGFLEHKHRCGYTSQMLNSNMFLTGIWMSTAELTVLDTDFITKSNCNIYNPITEDIIKLNNDCQIILCGMGVETYVNFEQPLESILKTSKNVNRWIVSDRQHAMSITGFTEYKSNNLLILSREQV